MWINTALQEYDSVNTSITPSLSLQGVRVFLGRLFDQPNTSHILQKIYQYKIQMFYFQTV